MSRVPSQGLSEAVVRELSRLAPLRTFNPGSLLCMEGKPASACLILLSGEVEVRKQIDNQPVVVARLGTGSMVGQLALIDGAARSATVAVTRTVQALVVERELFQRLLASRAPLALAFQREVATSAARQLRAATRELAALRRKLEGDLAGSGEVAQAARRKFRNSGAYVAAALSELSVPMGNLDAIEVVVPDGQVLPAELRMRFGRV